MSPALDNIMRINARDRRRSAVHEAGHVIITKRLGFGSKASIWPTFTDNPREDNTWSGRTSVPPWQAWQMSPKDKRMVGIAGMVAEDVWRFRDTHDDAVDPWYWQDHFWDTDCMSPTDWQMCGQNPNDPDLRLLMRSAAKVARLLTTKLWPDLISTSRRLIVDARATDAEPQKVAA